MASAQASFPSGFRIGHWTHPDGGTGCTVILPPPGNVCSYDIRGASPGSRELASLDVERQRTEVHAVLLTGGSAHGLAAADGAMRWCEEHGLGFKTPIATIPIVPAAVIFDAAAGDPSSRPGADAGYAACEAAADGPPAIGRVGAGAGATIGKWAGREFFSPGGLGVATANDGDRSVSALAVVNAVGDVLAANGTVLAGTRASDPTFRPPPADPQTGWNTVLVVVATTATLTKADVRFLAARASDGVTRTVSPAHTRYDGDVSFAIAAQPTRDEPATTAADLDRLAVLATESVAAAIRAGVAS